MDYPAIGFGRSLPASFASLPGRPAPAALTPYSLAASAFAWPRGTSPANGTLPSAAAQPAGTDAELVCRLQSLIAQYVDGGGSDDASGMPRARSGAGPGQDRGGGAIGTAATGTAATGAGAGAGQAAGTARAPNVSASSSAGGFLGAGPVDISGVPGLALGALSMAPGIGGVVGTLAGMGLRVNNMLAAQQMLEEAGLPGYDTGQWIGGALGWNGYGSGSPNSPIGYTEGGTAITPSGYKYGTDGLLGPLADVLGLGDGWSYAKDPGSAGLEAKGITHHNQPQMPSAMRRDLHASLPSPAGTGTGGSSSAGRGTPNVSAHTTGGAGFTQHDRAGATSAAAGGSTSGARSSAQQVA